MTDRLALKRVAAAAEELARKLNDTPYHRQSWWFSEKLAALESALKAAQARREA